MQISPYGVKGITGYRRPSDNKYILFLTTYHSSTCAVPQTTSNAVYCSVLLQYDPTAPAGTGTTLLASPGSNYAFVGLTWAPIAPSATPSVSATASLTASGTPSNSPTPTRSATVGATASNTATPPPTPSNTASVSNTASDTPSVSLTASVSQSPTPTQSVYPSYGGAPFTPGNLAVLRVGDGLAGLVSTGTVGHVLEINPASGAVVQTIQLPTVSGILNGTYRGACTFYGSATTDVQFSAFANGMGLAIG